eukprot:516181-Pleurochrysis_carterae.AAC.1
MSCLHVSRACGAGLRGRAHIAPDACFNKSPFVFGKRSELVVTFGLNSDPYQQRRHAPTII